jgi:hypothetical protein
MPLGFDIGPTFILRNYKNAEAYFTYLLTKDDIVDTAPLKKRFSESTTFSSYLTQLKHNLEIIEFEPYQYINIRRLQAFGVNKDKLKNYANHVFDFLIEDVYFTVHYLRRIGFEDKLDDLGFEDLFYSSLLKEDSRLSWSQFGKNIVFNTTGSKFTMYDFILNQIGTNSSINIYDFKNELFESYGIVLEKYDIIEKIKDSTLFYDPITETIYSDYDTYFEEV